MKFPFFPLVWLLLSAAVFPAVIFSDVTSGADFLKNPRSARAIALGESYTAILDDPTAIDYNPAALNTIRNIAASLMYQTWIENGYGVYMSGAYRLSDLVIGGSVYWFNYGGLKEYDTFGYQIGQYDPSDLNVKIAASLDAGLFLDALQGMSLGACFSVVSRNMLDQTLLGFTVDAGINYKTTLGKIVNSKDDYFNLRFGKLPVNAGFVVQNIGFAAETLTPVRFAAGMSFGVLPEMIVSLDLSKDVYNTPWVFKMGAEYTILDILSLRVGLNLGNDTGIFSMGVGLRYPMTFNNLRFDYAFTPFGVLGNSHNFSLYADFKFDIYAEDYYIKGVYYFSKREYLNTREMWKKARELEPKNELYKERLVKIEDIVKIYELETNEKAVDKSSESLELQIVRDLYGDKPGAVVNNGKVTFFYRSINRTIQSVALTGDYNSWDTNGIPMLRVDEGWTITLALRPGKRQYKYIIDGNRVILDPANPNTAPDGMGGKNSVIEVPEAGEKVIINVQEPSSNEIDEMLMKMTGSNRAPVTNAFTNSNSGKSTNEVANTATNMLNPSITNTETIAPLVLTNVTVVTNRKPKQQQKVIFTNMNIQSTNDRGNGQTNSR